MELLIRLKCDLDMFVQVQWLKESPRYFSLGTWCEDKTGTRMNGTPASHHIPSRMGETPNVKPTTSFPGWSQVQTNEHRSKALGDWKQAQALGDHERRVEIQLPERLRPFMEGLTMGSSSSTNVSPAAVAIPPSAIHPSVRPLAKAASNKSGGTHNLFTHLPKDPNCEVCKRTKVMMSPCKKPWRSGG